MINQKLKTAVIIIAAVSAVAVAGIYISNVIQKSKPIKIVTSFPMRGINVGVDIVNGIKMALEEGDYRIDGRKVELVIEDDGDESGTWSSSKEWEIATRAAEDEEVLVYMGPFNSGAAKVSIPVTNESGLPQVSPGNTWPGLTKPGFAPGEPDAFYPTGMRSYFRNCPTDAVQGPAAAIWAKELGYKNIYIFDDGQAYGSGIAGLFEAEAIKSGLNIYGHQTINNVSQDIRAELDDIKKSDVDLIYFGGITTSGAIPLLRGIKDKQISAAFMGSDGIMEQAFIDQAGGAAEGVYVTQVGIPPSEMTEKGKDFVDRYKERYGVNPGTYSGFGYESMKVVMKSIKNAKKEDRAGILKAISETKNYDGLFGKWSFDENGDTTLLLVSGNKVENGKFVYKKLISESR